MLNKNNIVAIIQARMSSTRLPAKVLLNLNGKTVLNHVVDRVIASRYVDKVIVATSGMDIDDKIIDECNNIGVESFRGSLNDVLSRYYFAAEKVNAQNIIRITSDCPLISTKILDKMLQFYIEKKPDYLSNTIERTFPRGLDVEIFTFNTLKKVHLEAKEDYEKEHVTPYIYFNKSLFNIMSYKDEIDNSNYRWTLDTIEDWHLIEKIYNFLYADNNNFEYADILKLYKKHPELVKINQHIEQKRLGNE